MKLLVNFTVIQYMPVLSSMKSFVKELFKSPALALIILIA